MAPRGEAPTASEVEPLAQKVAYEYVAANAAARKWDEIMDRLDGLPHDERDYTEQNAWLEVFVLHARNIYQFFKNTPNGDDVLARHYVADWNCSNDPHFLLLDGQRERTNKWLAHLTAHRVRAPETDKGWPVRDMLNAFNELWKRFTTEADPEQRDWFELQED